MAWERADLFSYIDSVRCFFISSTLLPAFVLISIPTYALNVAHSSASWTTASWGIVECEKNQPPPTGLVGQRQSSRIMSVLKCESDLMKNYFGFLSSTVFLYIFCWVFLLFSLDFNFIENCYMLADYVGCELFNRYERKTS